MNGKLTVVTGPMFAGKTSYLLSIMRRQKDAGKRTALFKRSMDTRYSESDVVSHDGVSLPAVVVHTGKDIHPHLAGVEVIGVDEGQFFDSTLVSSIAIALAKGIDVYVSTLDKDSNARPFGLSPQLIAMSDKCIKLTAKCKVCSDPATMTYRYPSAPSSTVAVGGADLYEPRCEPCYVGKST